MFAPKKILVPTDFSKFSDEALKQAYDIAKKYKAKLYLLHVVDVIQQCAVDYCMDQQTLDSLDKQTIKASEDMMEKQIKKVAKSKDVEIISDVKKGTSYEEILKEQEAKKIDLIVIASHGRTGLMGHLIGSVAERVARGAKCPVILVKNK
jgi:nucleotide-binding universal stress UspA family protein